MECARLVREKDQSIQIVFVTASVQYAVQGYRVNALDYIVKPVTPKQLRICMGRALRKIESLQPRKITFKAQGTTSVVTISDILWVEAVNHSASAHLPGGIIPCGMTLSAVEHQLISYGFFRCHTAFLINLAKVEQVTATDAVIAGQTVPVSKHRRKELLQALTAWWGRNL